MLVSAHRGAALACRAPRAPVPSPPTWPGRHPPPLPLDGCPTDAAPGWSGSAGPRSVRRCATRGQRPGGWANQKVLYDAKRRIHTAQGVALSTIHGDLLWCDGGWPGSCHEHESLEVSGVRAALDATGVTRPGRPGIPRMAKARALARADRGPTHQRPAHAGRTRPQPPPGRACAPWWRGRSGSWPTPGRCGADVACCTGSGTSTGPPRRSAASADGSTASRHDRGIPTPSLTNWSTML